MSFWDFFFLLLIYVPLMLMWTSALLDIFRRDDLSGVMKALWVTAVILLPFFGTLIYLVFRPAGATAQERAFIDAVRHDVAGAQPDTTVQQLATLADLHDRGKITADEYAEQKARLIGGAPATEPVTA
jgi:Phospholipase_D-nuclease N-terminal/Short C-terminal domain